MNSLPLLFLMHVSNLSEILEVLSLSMFCFEILFMRDHFHMLMK